MKNEEGREVSLIGKSLKLLDKSVLPKLYEKNMYTTK